jgi:hypothetical protein
MQVQMCVLHLVDDYHLNQILDVKIWTDIKNLDQHPSI